MKIQQTYHKDIQELSDSEMVHIHGGGGPISEALEWYYKTVGSFYRGLWDGLTGAEPKV